jgi:hypothetical protein
LRWLTNARAEAASTFRGAGLAAFLGLTGFIYGRNEMTEVYLKKIRQDECPSCGKALRQPQTEQGLSVGEIGLVYASAIEAVEEQQTDALKAENERLRSLVYLYVDPSDVTPEDEEFVRAAVNAVLQEQSK